MEMYLKENGLMIKNMKEVDLFIKMDIFMKEKLKKEEKTEKEY